MELRWWYVTGKLCGFPECCIISFALGKKAHERDPLYGTGYVPCSRCANHSVSFLTSLINKNRDARLSPFPNDVGLVDITKSQIEGKT